MVNEVTLIGNLGRDPDLRFTQGGTAVCNLSVATSRKYKGADGQLVEETEWHRVTVWGKQAAACQEYLAKGRQVYVKGRLRTSSYEKDGEKRYSTEVVAVDVKFLGSRSADGPRHGGGGSNGPVPRGGSPGHGYDDNNFANGEPDDIPF